MLVNVFKSKEVYSSKSGVLLDSITGEDVLFVIAMNFREVCNPIIGKGNKFLTDMCEFYKEAEKHTPDHLNPERDVLFILYNEKYEEASVFVEFVHFEHANIETLTKLFRIFNKLANSMKAHAYLRYFDDYGEHIILTLMIHHVENPESPIWDLINKMVEMVKDSITEVKWVVK